MTSTIKLSSPATREFWEIPVVYEDDHLLALDKPSELPGSPDRNDPERPNLITLLHAGIAEGKPWARERRLDYLMNAHRLDAETTGVLLLAKQKAVLVALANLFGSEQPVKHYIALVRGTPSEDNFEVNASLAPHPVRMDVVRVDSKSGKRALTRFAAVEKFSGWTLLKCEPLTERTHQIRAHLRHAGLPIVGDRLYGGKPLFLSRLKRNYRLKPGREERPLLGRLGLHAEELSLSHPVTGAPVTIFAPWPKDLAVALKYLRQYAAG